MKYLNFDKQKIDLADQYHKEWSDKFKCKVLEEYYEGFQHKLVGSEISGLISPYTLNLVYATIQTKLANMILNAPQFETQAKPRFSDWDAESAYASANLKQDAINTIIENPNISFVDNVKLSALDYFFWFSVMEIGYAADWQNPNMPPPVMKSDLDSEIDPNKDKVVETFDLPLEESVFFKRIHPERFRVSLADSPMLRHCSWCGYYSYFYREVLENTKGISFTEASEELRQNPQFSPEYQGPSRIVRSGAKEEKEEAELQYLIKNQEVLKMWTIWNNKTKKKCLVYHDTASVCWEDFFDYIPLATNRANYRTRGWYPIPPVWYWLSPQNEINEACEQMRNIRRRFKRKYKYIKGKIEVSELEKLGSDVDGEAIAMKDLAALDTIQNTEIGISIKASLSQGHADFNLVTGTSQVRESDRETATKSKIISLKEQVRENVERQNFDSFVCEAGRLGLVVMSERLTLPMWIKYTTDPSEDLGGEVNDKGPIFRLIDSTKLDDGYDFTVKLRVIDGSDTQMEAEMQKFVAFLSIVNQFPQIAMDPLLIREAAYKTNYRNEKVIKRMQQMAQLVIMGQMAAAQKSIGGGQTSSAGNNKNASKSAIANSNPNPTNEINQQMFQQV